MFGPREQLLTSQEPVVRQFLNGRREGPIGMSEEKDVAQVEAEMAALEARGGDSRNGIGPKGAGGGDAVPVQLGPLPGADLPQGGIIETYEQVSATTRYEVDGVGLQQVDDAQDTATLVVFGRYVVESVNSGRQAPPEGSECQVTPEGAQSCVQTVQLRLVKTDGEWKIGELTLLTTS